MDRELAISYRRIDNSLDDDYTLFESGKILHEFDANSYPGGQNHKRELTPDEISMEVKTRLLNAAHEEDKEIVKKLLRIA